MRYNHKNNRMMFKSKTHEQFYLYPETFLERIVLNMLETHRNITELAQYYAVPRSTLYNWLCKANNLLSYDMTKQMHAELKLHQLKVVNMHNHGDCYYYTSYNDGPLD